MAATQSSLQDVTARLLSAVLRYKWVIEALLIAALLWLVSALVWALIAPGQTALVTQRALPTMIGVQAQQGAAADRTRLVRLNPFETGAGPIVADAPETTLDLNLEGLFMSVNGPLGSASIRLPNNQVKVFRPGDEVLDGVYLEAVQSDRVVLNRNGAREMLLKFGRGSGFSAIDNTETALSPFTLGRLDVEEEITGQARDAETLLLGLELTPVRSDGALTGYRIMPRGSLDVMASAGLLPGDLVTGIEGIALSESDVSSLINELQGRERVDIEVLRRNARKTIRIVFSG